MRLSLLFLFFWLSGCNLADTPQATLPTVAPIATPTPDGWQTLAPGLERRTYLAEEGYIYEAVRIDPNQYSFRAHYRPGEPLRVDDWQTELTGAAVIINANFFSPDNTILGLLISDGIAYGRSYTDRGGTFFVQGGTVGVRSNINQPYQGEPYEQAIQAFPMLVYQGQAAYSNSNDIAPSRRTIIGQDAQGRVILIITPAFGHGLYNLSQYLVTTDLGLVNAFNLDGGGSTLMYRAVDNYVLRSLDPVPAVLAVYPIG
jgi:uncharacterized protein YigE (DUF2233 family)